MARFVVVTSLILCLNVFVECSSLWSYEDSNSDEQPSDYDYDIYTNTEGTTLPDVELTTTEEDEIPLFKGWVRRPVEDDEESTTVGDEDTSSKSPPSTTSATEDDANNPINPRLKMLIEDLTRTIDNLTSQVRKQETQLSELVSANVRLQEKVDSNDEQIKTNSLIFFNVAESNHENYKTTLRKVLYILNKVLKLKTKAEDIAVAMRSDTQDGMKHRPIKVRFTNFATKMMVLAAKSRLNRSRVVIESDYSEKVARIRAQLVPYMDAAKAQGLRAFILYDCLVVNDEKFTLQELQSQAKSKWNSNGEEFSALQIVIK